MLTHTLPSSKAEIPETPALIEQAVDERGFYLYEWISPDELRMSVLADYLSIIQSASIPLAIVTVIAGLIGFGGGVLGAFILIFGMLAIFYTFVLILLIIKMIRKSYLYTRGANVVITDHHYVSAGKVVEREDFSAQKNAFSTLEKIFREPLLEPSGLALHIENERKNLFDQLKDIALGGGKIMQNVGRSRDAGGIIIVLMLAGILYGGMMALVYFLGVFFVSILARVFSWFAHRALLAVNNTEHEIQTLFVNIDTSSHILRASNESTISLLDEAGRNDWKENLLGKISESLKILSDTASLATEDTQKLRALLESSQYKDIFNFSKYGNWVKKQILEPIEEILLLLEKNHVILEKAIESLDTEILSTTNSSHKSVLALQKERLEIQAKSFEKNINLMRKYKEKLS